MPAKCTLQSWRIAEEVGLTHVFVLHPLDSEHPEVGKFKYVCQKHWDMSSHRFRHLVCYLQGDTIHAEGCTVAA